MRRFVKIAALAGCFIAIWICIAPLLAGYLIVERPLESADAIIVLSGSAVYRERTLKAAELFKQGVAGRIFITNDGERSGWSKSEKRNPTYVEMEQRELITNGVSPDAITVLPGEVSGTDQEAKALAAELKTTPIRSLVIVTSPYHTRRSLRTFEKILKGENVELGIVHSPLDGSVPSPNFWWLSARGWQSVGLEYVKSAAYYVYY